MKLGRRIGVCALCVALLLISWAVALSAKSDTQKQTECMKRAMAYLEDEVYIRAQPLLEEAVGYQGSHTAQCEELLKKVYLALIDQRGYADRYTGLLDRQMGREDATSDVFLEAAHYYLGVGDVKEALSVLRGGMEKLGSQELEDAYEANRYTYSHGRNSYLDVTTAVNGAIQVKNEDGWGLARANGTPVVRCQYEKVSTYWNGEILVKKNGVISGVNTDNNRLALLHEQADDFGNYNEGRTCLRMADGWHQANGEFAVGATQYDALGLFSGGYAAACQNGRWGVIDQSGQWYIPAQYDGVVMDEVGRCWGQDAVFVRQGEQVILCVAGKETEFRYQDAQPFGDSGYAAVMRDGSWGFIDVAGTQAIPFQFDNALSFGQHLAAVEQDGSWGYVSLKGQVVIEPSFLQAKSFYNGSAPVRTVDGWEFITLTEYEAEASL